MCQMGLSCLGSQMDRKGNFLIDECGHLCFNLVDCPSKLLETQMLHRRMEKYLEMLSEILVEMLLSLIECLQMI